MKRECVITLLLSALLVACATPQAALDQANHGAVLVTAFRSELERDRKMQSEVASARLDSIRRMEEAIVEATTNAAFDDRLSRLAGSADALALRERIRELADSRAGDERTREQTLAELDARYAKLLVSPPGAASELASTERALAVLGVELSTKDRIAMGVAMASEIQKTVKENKIKIDEARKSAADAVEPPEEAE